MTTARYSTSILEVTVGATVEDSEVIAYGDYEKGMIFIPVGSLLAVLTWYVSSSEDGEYLLANNGAGNITQAVTAGKAYYIPEELAGARFLKIAGDDNGVVDVTLKD